MNNGDDSNINESTIDDLIQYSEEENDTPDTGEAAQYAETEAIEDVAENEIRSASDTEETDGDTGLSNTDIAAMTNEELQSLIDELDGMNTPPEKKGSKWGIVIGILIGVIVAAAFITIDSGIIGTYKENFSRNFSKIFRNFKSDKQYEAVQTPKPDLQYKTSIEDNIIVSLEEANKTEFAQFRDGIVYANMNHLTYLDTSGNIIWETDTAIVDPILCTEGNYILLAEKNGNKLCLYADRKLAYDTDDPDKIITASLSSSGDAVVVTDKSSYKGGISVYNKSGARIFSWASGSNMVISADISAASRRVAVAALNTENTVGTTIQLFDVNKTDSYAKINIDNTVIFDMHFIGDTLNAFGDNRMIGISTGGRLLFDNTFENEQLTHSAADEKGNMLLTFDDGNIPMINVYGKNGKLKSSTTLTGIADFADINGKNILYNLGRDVYFGRANSKTLMKYTAAMDIRNLIITSDTSFVIVYSNSIEFVKM